MRTLTTQLVVLILGIVAGLVALVICLAVWADWSDGAVVGMVSAFGTLGTGLIVAIRNQERTGEVLAAQDEKLETIERNTNGRLEARDERIAQLEDQVRGLGGRL